MRLFALLSFLSCFCFPHLNAQSRLVLVDKHDREVHAYLPGASLSLQCAWQSTKVMGTVMEIEPGYFRLSREVNMDPHTPEQVSMYYERIATDQVMLIYPAPNLHLRAFQRGYSIGSMAIGGLIIGGTVISALMNERTPQLEPIGLATGILFSGLAVRYLGRRKYRLGKKWHLEVRD